MRSATDIITSVLNTGTPVAQEIPEITAFLTWYLERFGQPKCVMEIGTHMGGTAMIWCEIATEQVMSVDMPNGVFGGVSYDVCEARNNSLVLRYPHFVGILGNSHDTLTQTIVSKMLSGPLDILFLDGDHTYQGVKQDYEMYQGYVRSGGVILFHDIEDTPYHRNHHEGPVEVCRVWNELQGEKHEFTIHSGWCGLGAYIVP